MANSTHYKQIREASTEGARERRREKFRDKLQTFTGTSTYWEDGPLFYTDGVKFLTEEGHAYWLLDVLSSYSSEALRQMKKSGLRHHAAVLRVEGEGAAFEMYDVRPVPGNKNSYVEQDIPYTDFPLKRIELVVGPKTSAPVVESMDEIEGIIASLPSEN